MEILIIEDEYNLADIIKDHLVKENILLISVQMVEK